MADVLTQSQIDALLSSMQGGGDTQEKEETAVKEEKSFRFYDFYSPKKFTKDRLRILKGVYDNYCRIASSQVNSLFRTNSEMEVVTVEEQRYYEYSNALAETDMLTLVDVKVPENVGKLPPILMHMSPSLMVNLIDRMLGGSQVDEDIDPFYVYTELEMPLYRKVMEYLTASMQDAWSSYLRISPKVDRIVDNTGLYQTIGVDETVVIIMLNVSLQEETGRLSICIPEGLLMGIFSTIDNHKRTEDDYENALPDVKKVIFDKIRDSVLTVKAELGSAEMSMGDIYGLKVGDVINLNKSQNSTIRLFVEEQPWFEGQLGVSNKKVAVKIENRLDIETDDEPEMQTDDFESAVSIDANNIVSEV